MQGDRLREEIEQETLTQRRVRDLQGVVDRQGLEIAELRKRLGFTESITNAIVRPPKWTRTIARKKGRKGIVTLQLTDTHFDEVVRPEEVDYINAYNRQIAVKRLRRWAEKSIVLARDYVQGVEIEGAVVFATGDILSGDIHDELKQSNEDHLYSSAIFWIEKLSAAIDMLATEFGRLHVAAVVGNHGRSTVKPVFKGRARSNIEWLVWNVLAREFAQDDRVTFQVSDSMDLTVPVYRTNYLITHGDQFKGGSGISGALAPLMLGKHRKTVRQMATDAPMDIMVMGHFHQYLTLPGLMVGGSMKGYDEFAYGHNLGPEPARQAFWITSPEHGPTIHAPVHVQDRKDEGW